MKYFEITDEEKQILEAVESGKAKSILSEKVRKAYQAAAAKTLQKTANINLRLSQKDLTRLRAKGAREGIPYQTLAASVLHKFVADYL